MQFVTRVCCSPPANLFGMIIRIFRLLAVRVLLGSDRIGSGRIGSDGPVGCSPRATQQASLPAQPALDSRATLQAPLPAQPALDCRARPHAAQPADCLPRATLQATPRVPPLAEADLGCLSAARQQEPHSGSEVCLPESTSCCSLLASCGTFAKCWSSARVMRVVSTCSESSLR